MELAKTQKTLILCACFIISAAATLLSQQYTVLILAIIFLGICIYKKIFSYKFALMLLSVIVFSSFYAYYKAPVPDYLYKISPLKTQLHGRIVSLPKLSSNLNTKDKIKFEFEVDSIIKDSTKIPIKAKTLVTIIDNDINTDIIKIGNRLSLDSTVKKPYSPSAPGAFDYKTYLQNSAIFTVSQVKFAEYKLLKTPTTPKWFLIQKSDEIREKILDVHKKILKSPNLEILGGMVFGSEAVPPPKEIKTEFINSGLYHLLAASGMNVGFIFGFWLLGTKLLKLPYKFSLISAGIVVLIYAFMTGLPPSVLRATGMLEFILLGKLMDREADNLTLLALVCVLLLLYDPLLLKDVGFQLSFLATLGLLISVPALVDYFPKIPPIVSGAIAVPLVAQIWVAPIQIFHFNTFSTYSLLANIIVMPFMAIINFCGFIGSLFALIPMVGEKICFLADKLAEPFIFFLLKVAEYSSKMPDSLLYFGKPLVVQIIIFYMFIISINFVIKNKFKAPRAGIISLALLFTLFVFPINKSFSKDLSLTFFDVGEGDSIYIETPHKKRIIVDTGKYGKLGHSPAQNTVIPYLRDEGVKKIDLMVLTHPDSDHIGGAVDLLKNFKIQKIYSNGETSESKTYNKLEEYIKNNNIVEETLHNKNVLDVDNRLKIIAYIPENTANETTNDTSIMLFIVYKDFSTLLMADNETNSFKTLHDNFNSDIDLLKVGHHGSSNSINQDLISILKPKTAVISVGKNSYGHPSPSTLALLQEANITTFRTDLDKSIKIKTNGKRYKLYKFNPERQKWQFIVKQNAY